VISKRTKWLFLIVSAIVLIAIGGGLWWLRGHSQGALLEQVDLSIRAGKYDKAIELSRQYTDKHTGDWKGYYYEGRALTAAGRFEQAQTVLAQACELAPSEPSIWILYSQTFSQRGAKLAVARDTKQNRQAVEFYKSADEILAKAQPKSDTDRLAIQSRRGLNLIQWAHAGLVLSASLTDDAMTAQAKRDTKTSDALKADAKAIADQVEPTLQQAFAMLLAVVQKAPSNPEAANALVQLCLERSDQAGLAEVRQAIMGVENPSPLAAMMLVMNDLRASYSQSGSGPVNRPKIQAACQILDDILKKNPKDAKVKLARAELALRLDDQALAQRLCDEVVKEGGRNAQAELLVAEMLYKRGELGEAEKKLYQLKTDYPQFPDAQLAYARIAIATGKMDVAAEAMNALGKIDAGLANVRFMQAELALALGDLPAAQRACADILAVDPSNASARLIQLTVLARSGDIKTALANLKAMQAELPKWPDLLLTYAQIASEAGMATEALAAVQQAISLDPENSLARRFLVDLLLRTGQDGEAYSQAEAYCKANPSDAIALGQYAQAGQRTSQADAVRVVLAQAVTDNAARPEFLMSVVEAYGIINDTAAAKVIAAKVAGMSADSSAGRLAVARALVYLDRVPEAEVVLTDELKKAPNDARIHYQMGRLCAGAGRVLAAIDQFRAASELDKNNSAYKITLARMLMDSGDVAESAKIVGTIDSANAAANQLRLQLKILQGQAVDDRILQQSSGDQRTALALAYLTGGQLAKCVELCQSELAKNPDNANLRLMLARAYMSMGRQDEGLKEWEQVLKASPDSLANYLELASVLGQQQDSDQVAQQMAKMPGAKGDMVNLAIGQLLAGAGANDKAIAVLRQLADRSDAGLYIQGRARILLASSLAGSGMTDQAVAECDKLVGLADWKKPALLAKAQILAQGNQRPQAQAVMAELVALAQSQRDVAVLRAAADVYTQMKDYAQALAACDQIESLQPGDGRTWSLRARIYAADGKPDDSVKAYRKAIALTPSDFGLSLALVGSLDAQGKSAEAMQALKELETLGPGAAALAVFHRGRLFASWGLGQQAVECFTKLAGMGQSASPPISLALADACARCAQREQAVSAIKAIPDYAAEYVPAQLLLAQLEPAVDAKLAIIANLNKARPGQPKVLSSEMDINIKANRLSAAVAAYDSFKQAQQGKALPTDVSYMAVVTLLELNRQGDAWQIASQMVAQNPSRQWKILSATLCPSAQAGDALKFLPAPAQANLYESACGYYLSRLLPDDAQRQAQCQAWIKAIEQAYPQAGRQTPVAAGYLVLANLADGKIANAQTTLAEMVKAGSIDSIAAQELLDAVQAQPANADEAARLLQACLAHDLGLEGLSRRVAMEVLKARPASQWAASIALRSQTDPKAQAAILAILQPADSPQALLAQATMARSAGRFSDAADLVAKVAEKFPIADLLMTWGMDLERAGKLAEASAIYRRVWDMTKSPPAGNSLAYLTSQLYPQDSAKLAWAKTMMNDILANQPANPAFLDTLGWLEYLTGDAKSACQNLRLSVRGLPGLSPVHYHLGLAESACGNSDLARWHFQSAIDTATRVAAGGQPVPAEIAESAKLAKAALDALGPAEGPPQ
jgi:predicted Zn-dependent protease